MGLITCRALFAAGTLWISSFCEIGSKEYVDYLANLSSNFRSTSNHNKDIQVKLTNNKILIDDAINVARELRTDL